MRRSVVRISVFISSFAVFIAYASASTPVVTVTSPHAGSQDSSPVNFTATASSPDCSSGIAAMRIYPSSGDAAYTVGAAQLDVNINLTPGSYAAVVQAWDNCGGVGNATVNITVSGETLPPPKFVYSTEYSAGKIAGYLVNPQSGALTATGQAPVWAHWGPTRIASDSGGYRLYVANQGSHDVSAYFINRDNGYLSAVPGANFADGGWTTDIRVHPSNQFVYVSIEGNVHGNSGDNGVAGFSVASNGSLVPVPGSPFITNGGNFTLAIDPNGKYLYASGEVSNSDGGGVIYAFSIDQSNGALTAVPGSPYSITPATCKYCWSYENAYDLTIDRTGNFLIAPGYMNGVVYVYRIDQGNGTLTSVSGSPFDDDEISCPTSEYCTGGEPTSVTVAVNNKYLFVQNQADDDIVTFQIDASTGTLTLVSKSPSPNSMFIYDDCLRVDPSGSFLYSSGFFLDGTDQHGEFYGLAIDQANGSLVQVPGSPYAISGQSYEFDGLAVTP
jgi:6-phosphogluconolactonase (cycloisomerase 2 family)